MRGESTVKEGEKWGRQTFDRSGIPLFPLLATVRTPRDGGCLTPGLIDNHWHCMLALDYAVVFSSPTQHLDAIATWEAKQILMRGVTTVRDAGGSNSGLLFVDVLSVANLEDDHDHPIVEDFVNDSILPHTDAV